jgi:23S rRNA (pseudouridine1915-N3)-methyltransferase
VKIVMSGVRGGKTPWADAAALDYGSRIQRYFPFEDRVFKPGTADEDGARLLAALPTRSWLVVVDERGEARTSEGLAKLLDAATQSGLTTLWFALGGAYGHAEGVRKQARTLLSLSPMVLNHAVARVVLVEQIYRSCTIRVGEPYHHG